MLKKDGIIHLSTPNYYSFWPILEILINLFSSLSYKHQHINKFNKKKLLKFFSRNGFFIKKYETFIFISPFLGLFSFKFSIIFSKIEKILKIFFPGFLMYLEIKKN